MGAIARWRTHRFWGEGVIDKVKSAVRQLLKRKVIGRPLVRLRFRMSRLSTRIMAIMLFPLVLFFVWPVFDRPVPHNADPVRIYGA
jgi:hypothetical protein